MLIENYNVNADEVIDVRNRLTMVIPFNLEFLDFDYDYIRPDFYDYKEVKLCYILKYKFNDKKELESWKKAKADTEQFCEKDMLKFFKKEFMVYLAKDILYICWEVQRIIP